MAVFVVLALALLALAVGTVVVAVFQVTKAARRGRDAVEATRQRLQPLAEELQSELAVMSTETDAVGRRLAEFRAARSDRPPRGRKGRDR